MPPYSYTHKHRRTLNSALRSLHVTMKSIASALGLSPSALRRYRRGSRPASPDVLYRVAQLLRYQSDRLLRKAEMLEKLVEREETSAVREGALTLPPDTSIG